MLGSICNKTWQWGKVYNAVQASKRPYSQTVRSLVFAVHLTHANTVYKQYALDVLYIVRAVNSTLTTTGTDDCT